MADKKEAVIQFNDPTVGGGGCNVCAWPSLSNTLTELEIGTSQSTTLHRLCKEHLLELRTAVLFEYLKRVSIPGAVQRRKDGGIPPMPDESLYCEDESRIPSHANPFGGLV